MLEQITAYARRQRLGVVFSTLASAFVGVGVIAFAVEPSPEEAAPMVAAAIQPPKPISADATGLMLSGYDPVAYFVERKARQGRRAFQARWGEARYQFASRVNRDAFLRDPARFAPRFGGHDAKGVRQGALREADPTMFRIVNDRLYLLSGPETRAAWLKDERRHAAVGEAIWPALARLFAR